MKGLASCRRNNTPICVMEELEAVGTDVRLLACLDDIFCFLCEEIIN